MKVLVTGASGLIGEQLCRELLRRNHELVVLGRESEHKFRAKFTLPCEYYNWSKIDTSNVNAVIHLAGDSIASGRWTAQKKRSILSSRVETTKKLAEAFNGKWPEIFIGASAIGYYGNRGDEFLTENSSPGSGFLSEVCQKWESSCSVFKAHCRVVQLRLGVVLDSKGGFLEPMENLFSLGLGGKIGSGNQWMSWIHCQDAIQMFIHALESNIEGIFNAASPTPVTNSQWTNLYAQQLGVSAPFSTPSLALKILLGEMSSLATDSQRVSSKKIESTGFNFAFKDLNSALANLYIWKRRPTEVYFESNQWISAKKEDIFSFFSDAKNLERLTPPWLEFNVLDQSTERISIDTLIDYKISLKGIPLRWRTQIKSWNPPNEFSDDQLKGPYRKWLHTHVFESYPSGTLMKDRVIYEVPFGRLGQLLAGRFVKKDVAKIFSFRKAAITKLEKSWKSL